MGLDPAVIQIILMAIQTIVIGGGGVAAIIVMRNSVASIKAGVAANKEENAAHFKDVKQRFNSMETEMKELSKVLISIARFEERINSLDTRVATNSKQIDDMRRGIGYVSNGSRRTIDGEYP